ncbi:MAG: NfeD family protein [Acidimicrobiales bacterium]
MRRILSRAFITTILGLCALGVATPAGAESKPSCPDRNGCVRAVIVNGFIDEINVDFVERSIREAESIDGYRAVVLVVNSPGAVVRDEVLQRLVLELRHSTVPVSAWVGPSGAHAFGGAAELVAALPSSMAPRTEIGDVGAPRFSAREFDDLSTTTVASVREGAISEKAAVKAGIVTSVTPTLGDHVLGLKGIPSKVVKDDKGRPKRELNLLRVTQGLPVTIQLLHTAASPGVAYLALGIGIGLLLFEFFTAGVGVAGVVGAASAVMAAYGLAEIPIRPWALVLCLFSAVAFAIDIQTSIPRVWTAIGLVSWSVGSIFLFDGFRAPWLALATGIGGMAVTMLSGMPAMVRSRFATPTLGRDWMIGRTGVALTDIDPEGTVEVEGGQWRALTNRATPVAKGGAIRVVAIDGLTLEIEPPEGGAVDYREKRAAKGATAADS